MTASADRAPESHALVARLVDERGEALTRYAYFVSGDRDGASDLVQDALVKTFGRLRNGFTVTSAEAYVRRTILNSHLDAGRRLRRWRKIAHLQYSPELDEPRDAATEARLDLERQLRRLAPRERACIVLRYYDDLKVDDIAATLEISPGAVKRYLSDALAKLSIRLQDPDSDRTDTAVANTAGPSALGPSTLGPSTLGPSTAGQKG
ncbi:MAG: sigma-70 family RNA polymerase sigma factor [Salinibacterium sp.]|nr:sigma-70 family RNA polymerase sigma factor [Salinibacterium sp.]